MKKLILAHLLLSPITAIAMEVAQVAEGDDLTQTVLLFSKVRDGVISQQVADALVDKLSEKQKISQALTSLKNKKQEELRKLGELKEKHEAEKAKVDEMSKAFGQQGVTGSDTGHVVSQSAPAANTSSAKLEEAILKERMGAAQSVVSLCSTLQRYIDERNVEIGEIGATIAELESKQGEVSSVLRELFDHLAKIKETQPELVSAAVASRLPAVAVQPQAHQQEPVEAARVEESGGGWGCTLL